MGARDAGREEGHEGADWEQIEKFAEIVNRGEPKQIEFTADKEGIFPIICQLHPAHVGGELVVLP